MTTTTLSILDNSTKWYDLTMQAISVSEAKQQLGQIVDRAHLAKEAVVLTKHGREVVVVIDAQTFFNLVEQLEDLEDARDAQLALEELEQDGGKTIPWEQVKAELGLT